MNQQFLAVSLDAAAKISGVGRSKLYEEIREGRLRARKAGRRTVILATDLSSWLQSLPALQIANAT